MAGETFRNHMKFVSQTIVFNGKQFRFNRFFGCLICKDEESLGDSMPVLSVNTDKQAIIDAVNDPFKMQQRVKSKGWKDVKRAWIACCYAHLLTWLCAHCYPLVNICVRFHLHIFSNAGEASMFYYSLYPDMKRQQTQCLPRAVFIAMTSRRFTQHGVLFIGAFLPTVRMHAWVIEDSMPADCFDKQWIHYRPVMMLL